MSIEYTQGYNQAVASFYESIQRGIIKIGEEVAARRIEIEEQRVNVVTHITYGDNSSEIIKSRVPLLKLIKIEKKIWKCVEKMEKERNK